MTNSKPSTPGPIRCHLLDTGYCLAGEHQVTAGAPRRTIECHALAALLQHPREGWLLWDTGYAPHVLAAARGWPFGLYRRVTPMHTRPEQAVAAQLGRFGLAPSDIRTVVISHFHADHIGGLLDFGKSTFVATEAAYLHALRLRGLAALLRGFIPALVPADFQARARLLPEFSGPPLGPLGPTYDLFGDGSILLVALPGHARGQIGMLAHTADGPLLLAADGCWTSRAYRERRYPGRAAMLIADDPPAVRRTIDCLHTFAAARPDVTIVPTHCPEIFARLTSGQLLTVERAEAAEK